MPDIASLVPEIQSSTLPLALGNLAVTYRPRLIPAIQENIEPDDADDEAVRSRLADDLCRVVVEWDLEGRVPLEDMPGHPKGSIHAGGPIPLDPNIVKYLPQPLLSEITWTIIGDAQPNADDLGKRLRRSGRNRASMRQN